jgi:hypothetical protein
LLLLSHSLIKIIMQQEVLMVFQGHDLALIKKKYLVCAG